MKINLAQLESHVAKTLAPLYLISGEELLQKQEAIAWIRQAANRAQFTEVLRGTAETGAEETLYTLLYTQSLLAEKRLLILDCRQSLPGKGCAELLQTYATAPPSNQIVIVETGKADEKLLKSAWYKAFEKQGICVTVWPIPPEQLPEWIIKRARRYQLSCTPDAARLLADYVEGNLLAAAEALEKIDLLRPNHIDKSVIELILTDESHYNLFDCLDPLIQGDVKRALHILQHLIDEGTELTLILWGISRELRLLAEMAAQLEQGTSFTQLFQRHRIFTRRQNAIKTFLTRFNRVDCWHYLSQLAEIDRLIKGAAVGDALAALQLFCLRFR